MRIKHQSETICTCSLPSMAVANPRITIATVSTNQQHYLPTPCSRQVSHIQTTNSSPSVLRINTPVRRRVAVQALIQSKLIRIGASLLSVVQQDAPKPAVGVRSVLTAGLLSASSATVVRGRDATDGVFGGAAGASPAVGTNL